MLRSRPARGFRGGAIRRSAPLPRSFKSHSLTTALLFLSLAGAGGAPWALAADDTLSRSSLKGLKTIGLIVEKLTPAAEAEGLTREQVQRDVELRLKDSGVPVAKEAGGFLYVNVQTVKLPDGSGHSYSIALEFAQPVLLVRDTQILVLGTTWSLSAVGTAAQGKLSLARVDVVTLVDRFVSAYRSVNPK